jgi:hypothetical protein
MTRRELIASLVAAAVALALVATAVDVLVAWRTVVRDDFRFDTASSRPTGLWADPGTLPGSPGARALGLDDDVAYRRAAATFRSVQPGRFAVTDPRTESLRGQAQLVLTRASLAESDRRRRSSLLNYLGVLPLDRAPTDAGERAGVLHTAIGVLQNAVRTDPANADAKVNLELLLRDVVSTGGPVNTPGGRPTGGERSGVGIAGSYGY